MVPDKSIPPFSLRASLIKDGVSLSLIRISKRLNGAKRRGRERKEGKQQGSWRKARGEATGGRKKLIKKKHGTMKEKEVVLSKSTAGGDN